MAVDDDGLPLGRLEFDAPGKDKLPEESARWRLHTVAAAHRCGASGYAAA